MKIAAENYRQHGNILATNEIMGLVGDPNFFLYVVY